MGAPTYTELRARLASTIAHHPDADVTDLRAAYYAAKLEAHIRGVLEKAPPLTAEQRDRLAGIFGVATPARRPHSRDGDHR